MHFLLHLDLSVKTTAQNASFGGRCLVWLLVGVCGGKLSHAHSRKSVYTVLHVAYMTLILAGKIRQKCKHSSSRTGLKGTGAQERCVLTKHSSSRQQYGSSQASPGLKGTGAQERCVLNTHELDMISG